MSSEVLLQLKDAHVHYGGVRALDGASVSLDEGEIVALMGPNGAGKSTVLRAIFGLAPLVAGEVYWHARPIRPVAHEMSRRGIAFVPQGRRVFTHLTVRENLEIGGLVAPTRAERERRLQEVLSIFPLLADRITAKAGALSGGGQQMLAIGRGLMSDPRVLLLDEPSLGLAPKIVLEVFEKVREINERHKTAIMVVEHNLKSLATIAHRAYLLAAGRVVTQDAPQKIVGSGLFEKVFLGQAV